jgi:transketolase
MRKQLVKTVENLIETNNKTVLLLGDIGVFGFRKSFDKYPNRVYNIGILEQSTIGLAAGLSKTNLIPIVHTIAPFIVERALEQLKIDFGYQKLNGNFISIGASYDYAALGPTHHCPADVMLLKSIPNLQIIVTGNSNEFDKLFNSSYDNGFPTYYRLSEYEHTQNINIEFGKANLIKKGSKATIICVGNMLDSVINATKDLDVTIIYYTTLEPFDYQILSNNFNEKIIIIEQFYEGSLNYDVNIALKDQKYYLYNIGMKRKFLINYGKKEEHDVNLGLDTESLRKRISDICMK